MHPVSSVNRLCAMTYATGLGSTLVVIYSKCNGKHYVVVVDHYSDFYKWIGYIKTERIPFRS